MKSLKYCIGLPIVAIVMILSGCSGSTNLLEGDTGQAEFVISAYVEDAPSSISTYEIVSPEVSIQSVVELGAKLGFTGEASNIEAETIGMANEQNEVLRVNTTTGSLRYSCLDKLLQIDPDLPSYDEAINIATDYLKEAGLWFSDIVAEEVVVGAYFDGVPCHLLVRFSRYVDGIPVTGPGNKFGVRIGDQGEGVEILMWHPELELSTDVETVSPDSALSIIEDGGGSFSVPADCTSIVIKDIYIGYYLSNINESQEYLLPVYVFEGKCYNKDGEYLQDYMDWVEAFE